MNQLMKSMVWTFLWKRDQQVQTILWITYLYNAPLSREDGAMARSRSERGIAELARFSRMRKA
jgi:hypothetical protein